MRLGHRRLVVLAVAAGACTSLSPAPATPAATVLPGTLQLPTVATGGTACAGIGLDAILTGSPSDPQVAWLIVDGRRRDVLFPDGYGARFAPNLEIVDPAGHVVARAGDRIDGPCVWSGDRLLILWPRAPGAT